MQVFLKEKDRRKILWMSLLLGVAVAATFWGVLRCGFVTFDDPDYVTGNPVVRQGLTWAGVRWAWTTGTAANWHPLTWLSHMLDIQLFGMHAAGHHLTSLLIHLGNTLILFWILCLMTGAVFESGLVAALFALHPLHVESVVWVAERKDVLSAFFGLLTILFYIRYVKRPGFSRFLLVLFFFALGLTAKPMLVTLPFVLILLDYWPLQRSDSDWRRILEKAPLFLLAVVSSVLTFLVQRAGGAVAAPMEIPAWVRLSNALVSYERYLYKTFWPAKLSVLYPHPYFAFGQGWSFAVTAGAALLLMTLTLCSLRTVRSHPYLAVGWLWFLGMMAPVIGLVQVGTQALADRYTYLPLVGIFIAAVWGWASLRDRFKVGPVPEWVLGAVILAACALVSARRIDCWKDSRTLYEQAISVTTNNWEMYNNLGNVFIRQGNFEEAIEQFRTVLKPGRRSIELRAMDLAEVYYNLGLAYGKTGKPDESIRYNLEALRLKPGNTDAWNNLGLAYAATGRTREAIAAYDRALSIRPEDPAALFNRGLALLKDGKSVFSAGR